MEDGNQMMKATPEWMAEKYDQMNEWLFHGELGECDFNVFTTGKGSQGGTLGWFKITNRQTRIERYSRKMYISDGWSKEYICNSGFNVCMPRIEINGNYTATEDALTATLVHEMCHYYTYMRGWAPKQAHGREFKEIGAIVSARSGGMFTIQRLATAEEMQSWQLDPEMQAKKDQRMANKKSKLNALLCWFDNGEVRLTTTSSMDLINYMTDELKKGYRGCKRIILSNDANFIDKLFSLGYKKNMRTWRWWEVSSKPWINEIEDYDYKEIFKKVDENMKSKGLKQIVEDVVKEFMQNQLNDGDISIDPNANLGLESPFEEEGLV